VGKSVGKPRSGARQLPNRGFVVVFQGASSLSLDAKGRLSVPTRHRDVLSATAGGQLTFTSRGSTEWLVLNITGSLFQTSPNTYAVTKLLLVDGVSQLQTVCHWISTGSWHDFSLTKIITGLSAGNHTLQLGIAAEASTTVQGDWALNVGRLSA